MDDPVPEDAPDLRSLWLVVTTIGLIHDIRADAPLTWFCAGGIGKAVPPPKFPETLECSRKPGILTTRMLIFLWTTLGVDNPPFLVRLSLFPYGADK